MKTLSTTLQEFDEIYIIGKYSSGELAKYDSIKKFFTSSLQELLKQVVPEGRIPNYQRGGGYEGDEEFNACRKEVLDSIKKILNK